MTIKQAYLRYSYGYEPFQRERYDRDAWEACSVCDDRVPAGLADLNTGKHYCYACTVVTEVDNGSQ